MSYCIDYNERKRKKQGRLPILTIMSFFTFLLLVNARWPEGADLVRAVLLAAKRSLPVATLEGFAEELAAGNRTAQAFSDFLHTLLL